jgi:hypothetical protein
VQDLVRLAAFLKSGHLTRDEFDAEKARLIRSGLIDGHQSPRRAGEAKLWK